MKRNDFMNALNNIDFELVEKAAPGAIVSTRRAKRLWKPVAIAAVCVAVVVAIVVPLLANKKVKYTFYTDGGTNGTISSFLPSEKFERIEALRFSNIGTFEAANEAEKETTKTYDFDGRSVTLKYVGANKMQYEGKEKSKLKKCGIVDSYIYENGPETITLSLYRETGILKEYFIHDHTWRSNASKRTMTDKELIDKAKSVVDNYYGKDVLEKYVCEEVYYNEKDAESSVVFRRMLHGYVTDGYIRVIIRNDGLVNSVICNWHFELDVVEDNVTKKMIQNAEVALRAQIPEEFTVQENVTRVMIESKTGKLYLSMYAYGEPTYDRNGNKIHHNTGMLFVNIE